MYGQNIDPAAPEWARRLLPIPETATITGEHRATVYRKSAAGVYPAIVRFGSSSRIRGWELWDRLKSPDPGAVQQANFSSERDKQKGGEAVRASKDRRRQAIVGIVEKLGDAPRFKDGGVNFFEWARMILREVRINSALMHGKGRHSEARILSEIAGQTEKTVVSAIKTALKEGRIGKTK